MRAGAGSGDRQERLQHGGRVHEVLEDVVEHEGVKRALHASLTKHLLDGADVDLVEYLTRTLGRGPAWISIPTIRSAPAVRSERPTPPAPQPTSRTRPIGGGSFATTSARSFSK